MSRIVHFDIEADNPQRANVFYSKVFGWELTKWEGPMDYWMIKTGQDSELGINGGMSKRGNNPGREVSHTFLCTIDVKSIDEATEKVTSNGGKVVNPKMPVPGVGWFALCQDTEGNYFSVMQNDPQAK